MSSPVCVIFHCYRFTSIFRGTIYRWYHYCDLSVWLWIQLIPHWSSKFKYLVSSFLYVIYGCAHKIRGSDRQNRSCNGKRRVSNYHIVSWNTVGHQVRVKFINALNCSRAKSRKSCYLPNSVAWILSSLRTLIPAMRKPTICNKLQ